MSCLRGRVEPSLRTLCIHTAVNSFDLNVMTFSSLKIGSDLSRGGGGGGGGRALSQDTNTIQADKGHCMRWLNLFRILLFYVIIDLYFISLIGLILHFYTNLVPFYEQTCINILN